jgi:hypothetical protein
VGRSGYLLYFSKSGLIGLKRRLEKYMESPEYIADAVCDNIQDVDVFYDHVAYACAHYIEKGNPMFAQILE